MYCQNKFFNQHKSRSSSPDESDNGGGGGGTIISSKSLFPDRNADKRKLEAKLNSINPIRPTTIKETQFRVGDVSISGSSNAFKKFQKFLTNQKKNKKSGTTNGVIQLHQNYLVVNQVRPVVIINSLILLI